MSNTTHRGSAGVCAAYISVAHTPTTKTSAASLVLRALAFATLLGGLSAGDLRAETADAKNAAAPAPVPQEKLDSLLAPIALYPDQLLTQTLMASTYPLDVVAAARFMQENKELKGEALDKAVAQKNWDPSVQSLTAYPQVLLMMNDKLDWTQELGDAFLTDEKRVMQTVQSLRQKAYAAGNLKSNEQQKVIKQETVIIVEPASPQVVYVPSYNPTVVYGTWWAPAYPPYYYPPPPYYYPPGAVAAAGLIGFGIGVAIADNHWGWSNADWHGGDVDINVNNNNTFVRNNQEFKNRVNNGNGSWRHNPAQRKGVAYGNPKTREQFAKSDPRAVSARRDVRGFDRDAAGSSRQPRASDTAARRDGASGGLNTASSRDRATSSGLDRNRDSSRGMDARPSQGSSNKARPETQRRTSDTRPSFDSNQSRQQSRQYSDRGASSRGASNRSGASRGGGGRRGR